MAGIIPDKFAIMTVDPGGTSGCATGVFRTDKGHDMLSSIFERAVSKGQIRSWEERGSEEAQAWAIAQHWTQFHFKCNVEYSIPIRNIYFVIEDFQLRELQAKLHSVAVNFGVRTLLVGKDGLWPLGEPVYQQPSQAKTRNNKQLKELGLWVVASEHRRDALRHMITKVSDILDGKS
jgi:hypothetical protein